MKWRVVEQYMQGKISAEANEDRLVITQHFAGVIDGVSSSQPVDGRPGGIVAADAVASVIEGLPPDATAAEFAALATEATQKAIGEALNSPRRPAASVVIWSPALGQVWRIGDCLASVDGMACFPEGKDIDRLTAGMRSAVIRAHLGFGLRTEDDIRTRDHGREVIEHLLGVQSYFANNPGDRLGYGVIDGTPVPERFIEILHAPQARTIVLASDGFPSAAPTLAEAQAARRRIMEQDPLGIRETERVGALKEGWTSYDDATYVRIEAID